MKVKMFSSSWSVKNLEKQVNNFINSKQNKIEIIDIKMSISFGTYAAMIIYKQLTADMNPGKAK